MDYPDVKTLLPHRFPILLVDKILELDLGHSIKTRFFVDPNLPVFSGHFPENPVFPGVYSIESMTQTGSCLLLADPKHVGKTPLFLGVNNARFLKPVYPGVILELRAKITHIREDKQIYTLEEQALIGNEIAACCEAVVILK